MTGAGGAQRPTPVVLSWRFRVLPGAMRLRPCPECAQPAVLDPQLGRCRPCALKAGHPLGPSFIATFSPAELSP